MNLDDIKDQIRDLIATRWEQIQESSAYISAKEQYDNLPTTAQKGLLAGLVCLVLLVVILPPLSWWSDSTTLVEEFVETKDTLRDFLKIQREIANAPTAAAGPSGTQLKASVDTALGTFGLLPEQIKETTLSEFKPEKGDRLISPIFKQEGIQVSLNKLNLKQVVDIGYRFQRLGTGVQLMAMDMKANQEDSHYYDVLYRVVSFSLPEKEVKEPAKGKGKSRSKDGTE